MIKNIKPMLKTTCKIMMIIYSILLLLSLSLTGLVFFDILTPDSVSMGEPLFSLLYLKLKCTVFLLFFIGVLFSMVTSKERYVHTGSFDSGESLLLFVMICLCMLSVVIFQPIPYPLFP
jgi:hypothetical protein